MSTHPMSTEIRKIQTLAFVLYLIVFLFLLQNSFLWHFPTFAYLFLSHAVKSRVGIFVFYMCFTNVAKPWIPCMYHSNWYYNYNLFDWGDQCCLHNSVLSRLFRLILCCCVHTMNLKVKNIRELFKWVDSNPTHSSSPSSELVPQNLLFFPLCYLHPSMECLAWQTTPSL